MALERDSSPAESSFSPIKICFIIRQLALGGAELQLLQLIRGLPESSYQISLVLLYAEDHWINELPVRENLKITVIGKKGRWDPSCLARLFKVVRRARPDILHGYLPWGNILATLLRPFVGCPRVVWGVRSSHFSSEDLTLSQRCVRAIERVLRNTPNLVVVNSASGHQSLLDQGFPADRVRLVRNGIDTELFSPLPNAARLLREKLQIKPSDLVIGLVARPDPKKGHLLFLKAASHFIKNFGHAIFLCVGTDPRQAFGHQLIAESERLGLSDHIRIVPPSHSLPIYYSAMNVCTLCSNPAEGTPNVVAEAMACGIRCVVTPNGDCAYLIGSSGIVTDRTPEAIAEAWHSAALLGNDARSPNPRDRIGRLYSLDTMIRNSDKAFRSILNRPTQPQEGDLGNQICAADLSDSLITEHSS
jgi:glycosyltransferase involved in cell wall biosynthesis